VGRGEMKITTLNDIDMTKYKLAYFKGNCEDADTSLEEVMKMAEKQVYPEGWDNTGWIDLSVVLIPKDEKLTKLWGDDWNDAPASCNAGMVYEDTLPIGSIIISGRLGDELKVEKITTEHPRIRDTK
jgi:hypothetical protein